MDPKEILKTYALSFVGLPYLWGGDTPMKGFDCSGFVLEILRSQGLWGKEDSTSQNLFWYFVNLGPTYLTQVPEFGSLLFFGSDAKGISHVTMALNQTTMLEAGGGDSTVIDRETAVKKAAFIRVRPIANRADLRGVFNPKYSWRTK